MKKVLFIAMVLVGLLLGAWWWFFYPNALSKTLTYLVQQQADFAGKALVISCPSETQVAVVSGLKGDYFAFEKIRNDLITRGRVMQGNRLADNAIIIFNGNCVGKEGDNLEILTALANLMFANPNKVFYLMGPLEEQWLRSREQTGFVQRFFEALPRGIYLFANDDNEHPVRIAPSDYRRFGHIACVTVSDKGPIRAVCTLGGVCSVEEGPLSKVLLGTKEVSYTEITVSSSLAQSTIIDLNAISQHREPLFMPEKA